MICFSYLKKVLNGFIVCLWCLFAQKTIAQTSADKIYLTTDSVLLSKVVSTRGDSIFYYAHPPVSLKILLAVSKKQVDKILFDNGIKEYYGGETISFLTQGKMPKSDIIYKKDGSRLFVDVVSTKGDSIHYLNWGRKSDQILYNLPKKVVNKIFYKTGYIDYFEQQKSERLRILAQEKEEQDAQEEQKQKEEKRIAAARRKKNIIKIAPLTYLFANYVAGGYERQIANGQSAEFKLGIIGLGEVEVNDLLSKGFFSSFSYKLIPIHWLNWKKPISPLAGLYMRPEFAFGVYDHTFKHETFYGYNSKPQTQLEKHHISYQCLMLNMGHQWVSQSIVADVFVGLGRGWYNQSEASLGIVSKTRFGYNMPISDISGQAKVKFKIGFYVGYSF